MYKIFNKKELFVKNSINKVKIQFPQSKYTERQVFLRCRPLKNIKR